jgi:hypothetical protein
MSKPVYVSEVQIERRSGPFDGLSCPGSRSAWRSVSMEPLPSIMVSIQQNSPNRMRQLSITLWPLWAVE